MPNILLIEDEEPIRDMLRFALSTVNFTVFEAETGVRGLEILKNQAIDLLLLDWMLPDQPGIEVAKTIRHQHATKHLPIIMLTARAEEMDKVRALSLGADDYVVKPFSPLELIARIQAILRRTELQHTSLLKRGPIELLLTERKATCLGKPLDLTALEFKLLQHFFKYPTQIFSRDHLLDSVWDRKGYVGERTVDTHIKKLRKILSDAGCPHVIETERGWGYRLAQTLAEG
jgi:two-component system phosphate regulon response regulator PhoB